MAERIFDNHRPVPIFRLPRFADAIAGVDEAGRGPLAGPVVAAVVVLRRGQRIEGVKDSKQLTPTRREHLAKLIRDEAVACCTALATPHEIDRLNILRATLVAMQRALAGLTRLPDCVRIDGNRVPEMPGYDGNLQALIGGDRSCVAIVAASILAKVERDRLMLDVDRAYPEYGFARHKGYPTRQHRAALAAFGPCPEHRRSFRPVRLAETGT